MLNPGNVAGEIYPATFSIWETDDNKFELIRINELKFLFFKGESVVSALFPLIIISNVVGNDVP